MFILTGLTFKVLFLDSNGADRRSIYERNSSRFHICEVDHHGRLNLLVTRVNRSLYQNISLLIYGSYLQQRTMLCGTSQEDKDSSMYFHYF